MFWLIRALLVTINNQSRSWSSIHKSSYWSGHYLLLSTINQDLDHPYTDVRTDQGLTCHCQQSIKILIIHTLMFWLIRALLVTINNQSRSWSSIHRCSDWSGPYLSLSTINQDLDHPYTNVRTDQGLTCHCQQSINILIIPTQMFCLIRVFFVTINNHIKILIIHTQMFWLIRALLVTINNQSRSWSSIHRCSDWSGPYLSLSTINQGLDHPYTDALTDDGLTCHYQQSIKILIIHTQMFWLIRALLVTINNQWRSWPSIHRWSDWSGPYLSLSTINQDLYLPYTDVLTDQGLTCHYQQSIKIFIIHTQMFCLIRVLLVTINNQSRSWSSIHRCSDWSGPYLSLSTINQDVDHPYTDVSTINQYLDHPYTDVLTDQGLTCQYQQSIKMLIIHTQMYQQSIKILIIHTQMFWLIRALLVTINNQWRSW